MRKRSSTSKANSKEIKMTESKKTKKTSSVGVGDYLELEACAAFGGLDSVEKLRLEIMRDLFENKGVSLKILRGHPDLNASLAVLERYAEGLGNVPFADDMGAGVSKAMPVRYYAKGPIMNAALQLVTELETTYVNLILAFLDKTDAEVSFDQIEALLDVEVRKKYPESFLKRSRANITEEELRESFPEFYRLKSRDDIWQFVVPLFRDRSIGFAAESLSPVDGLSEDLGMDSLDIIELFDEIDDLLGTNLCNEIGNMELTIGNLARLLEKQLPPVPSKVKRS